MMAKKSLDKRYTNMIISVMLARQIPLPDPLSITLTPLLRYSCKLFVAPKKLKSFAIKQIRTLCAKYREWVPVQSLVRCTEAQKHRSVTPLFATLTHSCSRKSFPCRSYENTRDGGVTAFPISNSVSRRLRGDPVFRFALHGTLLRRSPLTTFRINTCKSVSKQTTLTIFRINTYAKPGEGGLREV